MSELLELVEECGKVTQKGRGFWVAKRLWGEPHMGERCYTVVSDTGFSIEIGCTDLLSPESREVLLQFGSYPLTIGLSELQAQKIADILNGDDNG